MLRALLHQLLSALRTWNDQLPAIANGVLSDHKRLKEILVKVFQSSARHLCNFLDGLDEYDGSLYELCTHFDGLVGRHNGTYVKLCIAARPWVSTYFRGLPSLQVQDWNGAGIQEFMKTRLEFVEPSFKSDSRVERLVSRITTKAQGVFMWVRLAMDIILKGYVRGTTFEALEQRVHSVPKELNKLYDRIFFNLDHGKRAELGMLLYLTHEFELNAPQNSSGSSQDMHLRVLDLYLAYQTTKAGLSPAGDDLKLFCADRSNAGPNEKDILAFTRRVKDLSKGLLEVYPRSENFVRVYHETIASYLTRRKWYQTVRLGNQGELWSQICFYHIRVASKMFPEYFRTYCLNPEAYNIDDLNYEDAKAIIAQHEFRSAAVEERSRLEEPTRPQICFYKTNFNIVVDWHFLNLAHTLFTPCLRHTHYLMDKGALEDY